MRKVTADNVQQTTSTTGTGTVTLTLDPGWARFSDRFANGDRVRYSIEDGNNREVGNGTVGAANTLARTTILNTIVAGTVNAINPTAINLSGAAAVVRAVIDEAWLSALVKLEFAIQTTSFTAEQGFEYSIAGNSVTCTLPTTPIVGDRIRFAQGISGTVTGLIVDPGTEKINNTAGTMSVDVLDFVFSLVYVSAGYGWKVET